MTEEHSPTYDEPEQDIAGTAIDTSVPHSPGSTTTGWAGRTTRGGPGTGERTWRPTRTWYTQSEPTAPS